jgi:hypothetical protein
VLKLLNHYVLLFCFFRQPSSTSFLIAPLLVFVVACCRHHQPIFRRTAPFVAYLPAFQGYLVNTYEV